MLLVAVARRGAAALAVRREPMALTGQSEPQVRVVAAAEVETPSGIPALPRVMEARAATQGPVAVAVAGVSTEPALRLIPALVATAGAEKFACIRGKLRRR